MYPWSVDTIFVSNELNELVTPDPTLAPLPAESAASANPEGACDKKTTSVKPEEHVLPLELQKPKGLLEA